MGDCRGIALSKDEARGLMLAAQGLLDAPPRKPSVADVEAAVERLGAVQIDTISVVERSQYLVLWSRLGPYDPSLLDALLHPRRAVFEYWSHAASIVPMRDYAYYRPDMLRAKEDHPYGGIRDWLSNGHDALRDTLESIRANGPMASSAFEAPEDARRASPWDWYGPKESRRALETLWTSGDLMISSRRGGQKVYDLRERVLAEAFGGAIPSDDALPTAEEQVRYFARRTIQALGVLVPSWLWDYFRLQPNLKRIGDGERATAGYARTLLDQFVAEGMLVPATIEGFREPAYVATERLGDLERVRSGLRPKRTTLLSPFDSLIWHRPRAAALFGYEVCFEAYVVPEKRRYGYYCLAILHQGRLVGRIDAKAQRAEGTLAVRALYLEPGVVADDALLDGLADSLRDLARFLKLTSFHVERSEPENVAPMLAERLSAPHITEIRLQVPDTASREIDEV